MKRSLLIIFVVISIVCGTSMMLSTGYFIRGPGYHGGVERGVSERGVSAVHSKELKRLLNNYSLSLIIENGFQTFYMEDVEPDGRLRSFNVSFDNSAMDGGISLAGTGDPLSIGTAGLSFQFGDDRLSGHDSNPGTGWSDSPGQLQTTFGVFGGGGGAPGGRNPFGEAIIARFGPGENPQTDDNGPQGEGVGGKEPPVPIPEPATLLLLGAGLVGVAVTRRRKKSS